MNSNLIKIASLFTFAQTTDVEFGKRPDDRERNIYVEGLDLDDKETDEGKFTTDMMYTPGKWPYKKNENVIKRDKKIKEDKAKEADEEELDKISSSNKYAPKWTHDVIINYDTENFNDSQRIFMQRLGDAFWKRTCVHFVPQVFEESNKKEQFVRFIYEEPGCDEIIGMKDIGYERPQMQGMHVDCLQENTPQFTSHYLMHILGFDNEHQRPDAEDFITVKSNKSITIDRSKKDEDGKTIIDGLMPPQRFGREGHNHLLEKNDSVSFQNGPFDPHSLMMWGIKYVGDIKDKDGNIIENAHMASNISQVFLDPEDDDDDDDEDIQNHDVSKINKYYECEPMPELPKTTTPVATKTKKPKNPKNPKTTTPDATTPDATTPGATTPGATTNKPETTTPADKDPTPPTTTPTPITQDRDCIYHIKQEEGGDKKYKEVHPDCLDGTASINVWPAEDMIVDIELKWNIQEGGDELTDEDIPHPGRRMLKSESEAEYEKTLEEFTKKHTEEMNEIETECDKAEILTASNGDIKASNSSDCGMGTKSFTSQCGKGVKHDYIKRKPETWSSKGFKAYMQATAIYTKCPKRERGIALNGDASENSDSVSSVFSDASPFKAIPRSLFGHLV
jgi:hypothetical protein